MTTMEFVRQKEIGGLKRKLERVELIKKLKAFHDAGYSISEAAKELDIEESVARSIIENTDEKDMKKIEIGVHDAHWIMHALIHNWKPDEEK